MILIHERFLGDKSSIAPFIASLPPSYPTPFYWTEEDIQYLWPRKRQSIVQEDRKKISAIREKLLPAMSQFHQLFPPPGEQDDEMFAWAHYTVMTRGFYLPVGANDETVLMPFADLFNFKPSNTQGVWDKQSRSYKFFACEDLEVGEEVFVCYGRRRNWELLYTYGFVVNPNEDDSIDIEARFDPSLGVSAHLVDFIKGQDLFKYWSIDATGEVSHNLLAAYQIVYLSKSHGGVCPPPQNLVQKIMWGEGASEKIELAAKRAILKMLKEVKETYGQDVVEVENAGALRTASDLGVWLHAEGLSGPQIDMLLMREGELNILNRSIQSLESSLTPAADN